MNFAVIFLKKIWDLMVSQKVRILSLLLAIIQDEKTPFILHGYKKCNISSTKAWIFMKFETYANKILIDHKLKFLKDPCTHKCAPSLRLVRAYSHTDLPEILVGGQSVFYI